MGMPDDISISSSEGNKEHDVKDRKDSQSGEVNKGYVATEVRNHENLPPPYSEGKMRFVLINLFLKRENCE